MNLGTFLVPALFALIFLIFFGLTWWTSHSKSYRAWEMRQLQRELEELESRPRPPWADDPIAKSIEWTGTAEWGSDPNPNPKGAAVRIRSVSNNRIEFQTPTVRARHAPMLFVSAAVAILVYLSTSSFAAALLAPIIGMSLSVMFWRFLRSFQESLTFDKQLGMYWRGKSRPAPVIGAVSSEQHGRISDIYALQLIGTRTYIGDPRMGAGFTHRESFTHELNLVLQDGTRLSTVCLADYNGIDHDARILAAFLERPLWKPR